MSYVDSDSKTKGLTQAVVLGSEHNLKQLQNEAKPGKGFTGLRVFFVGDSAKGHKSLKDRVQDCKCLFDDFESTPKVVNLNDVADDNLRAKIKDMIHRLIQRDRETERNGEMHAGTS